MKSLSATRCAALTVTILLGSLALNSWGFAPSFSRRYPLRPIADGPPASPCRVSRQEKKDIAPLQASPLLTAAASPLGSLLILAGIILVHESGHYLAARSFGIEVEEFSVGVGPKILGFRAFGNEFNLRALPLGGYVRFPENYNATEVANDRRVAYEASIEFDQQNQMDLKTGILNALTLGAIDDQRKREESQRRLEAAEARKKLPWWQKMGRQAEKDQPVVLDPNAVEIQYYDNPNLLQNRPWQQRAVVLSAGVVFNLLLSFFIYFGQIEFGPGLPRPVFDSGIMVSANPRPDAAANGLLRKGDVILEVNGSPVTLSQSPTAMETQKAITDFVAKIRATPEGQSLELTVLHGDKNVKETEVIKVKPSRLKSDSGDLGPQTIGVLLSPNFVKAEFTRPASILEAVKFSADYVVVFAKETATGLSTFVLSVLTGKGDSSGQISGPIGLLRTGSEVVSTRDWTAVLIFAAAISINLGVVNAFPLPALDGGQLVFVLFEAISGRKVDQRIQENITGFALIFLLLASAGAALGDLRTIFGG